MPVCYLYKYKGSLHWILRCSRHAQSDPLTPVPIGAPLRSRSGEEAGFGPSFGSLPS